MAGRPSRWSPANWPVQRKVLAIVLVPLILAATFGGLRIYSSAVAAADLRLAADRAELIPDVSNYMAAVEEVLFVGPEGGDGQEALATLKATFNSRKSDLQRRLDSTDVVEDVAEATGDLLTKGQQLVDAATSNTIDTRQRVIDYVPLLLTAEAAITGSADGDVQSVQAQVEGLARAVGARGQMAIQQAMVVHGAAEPEPLLRELMITMAGTEPSTVSALTALLGSASEEAVTLRDEMVKRLALMSNPDIPLVGNQILLASLQASDKIAEQIIADNATAIPASVHAQANDARNAAIRDAILVAAMVIGALVIVLLVARSLVRPLRTLRDSALKVAHEDLAKEIERVRAGAELAPITPLPVHTTEEVGQVAHAVDELHEQAVFLAGEQAQLQLQVTDMFETLSRRSRSLVDQQLSLIDELERNEDDPQRLESLFRLDHLSARMRRNGANLLVLSGSNVAREHTEPVAVATIINAAASEVEDYARVVTTTVVDAEIIGSAAGDLIHLLAELLDNALRYSPPISQVRVSAVHAGDGALVIEVSDVGLGMTESDLRVANIRLQSGGEVNPYTARHMGLFVVGRLAGQHGLVVRLRSTIPDEPNSGTTVGVHVPAELLATNGVAPALDTPHSSPVDAHTGGATALSYDPEPTDAIHRGSEHGLNGHIVPFGLLPQRNPGASGISELPGTLAPAGAEDSAEVSDRPAPTNTSSFFAARAPRFTEPDEPTSTADNVDSIYQSMLSEFAIDPTTHARSDDLDWQTVWEKGWSVAAAAQDAPVEAHTEDGLPMRTPGARLVPGGVAAAAGGSDAANGGAQRNDYGAEPIASVSEPDSGMFAAFTPRDPEAARASISNHLGGVHAGRLHARETRGTDNE